MKELFGVHDVESFEPRYNIAPTQTVPVVRTIDGSTSRELVWMRWGLVPRWAKDLSIGARSINARAETVSEKPTFRDAFKKRRCLVVADGYYEWISSGKNKQPYFIHFGDDHPFAFAGLWERWQGPTQAVESFTIITTSAAERIAWLHDRCRSSSPRNHSASGSTDRHPPIFYRIFGIGSHRRTCFSPCG